MKKSTDTTKITIVLIGILVFVALIFGLLLADRQMPPAPPQGGFGPAPPQMNGSGASRVINRSEPGEDNAQKCSAIGQTWCENTQSCISAWQGHCLTVLTSEYPPYSFMGPDGAMTGETTDVVREILARTGEEASIRSMAWPDAYTWASTEPNVVLFTTARTPGREDQFKWVGPVGEWEYGLFAMSDSGLNITSLEAAKKAGSVCVLQNSSRHELLIENGFDNIKTVRTASDCAKMLKNNSADLWMASEDNIGAISASIGARPEDFKEVYPMRSDEVYIAFSRGTSDEIVAQWQRTLDGMRTEGTLGAIVRKYEPDLAAQQSRNAACMMQQAGPALEKVIRDEDKTLTGAQAMIEESVKTPEAMSGDWARIKLVLAEQAAAYPDAVHWYARPDGTYYIYPDGLSTRTIIDRPYFQTLLAGGPVLGDTVISRTTGRYSVIVAVPIINAGRVTGMVGASMFLDNMTSRAEKTLALPPDVEFVAIDSDGKIVLDSNHAKLGEMLYSYLGMGQVSSTLLAQDNGTVLFGNGMAKQMVFETSPLMGWHYAVIDTGNHSGLCMMTNSNPPFSFMDENSQLSGQSSDVVREIMRRVGENATIEMVDWGDALASVKSMKQTAIFSAAQAPPRNWSVKWVGPIASTDDVFWAPISNATGHTWSLDEAKRAGPVCVLNNTARQIYLQNNGFESIVAVQKHSECVRKLADGDVALWFGGRQGTDALAAEAGVDPLLFWPVRTAETKNYYIAFSSDTPDATIAQWQAALRQMKEDGTLANITSRYETQEPQMPEERQAQMDKADQFCAREDVAQVAVCSQYVKVVGAKPGSGTTFWLTDGTALHCQTNEPASMVGRCRLMSLGSTCAEDVVCDKRGG